MLAVTEPGHIYLEDGQPIRDPCVTQVINRAGLAPDYSMIDPTILRRKAEIGRAVHAACALIASGKEPPPCFELDAHAGYVDAYRRFLIESRYEPVGQEQPLRHLELAYVGTPDSWGYLNHEPAIPDLKCTVGLHRRSAAVQIAAYARLIEAAWPTSPWMQARRYVVHLRSNGTYRLEDVTIHGADAVWLAALAEAHGRGDATTAEILRIWKEHR